MKRARLRLARLSDAVEHAPTIAARQEAAARLLASQRSTFAHWEYADSHCLRAMVLRELGLHPDTEND